MATASVNRRDFMRVLALGSGLAAATACAGATPAPAEPTAVPPATAAPSPPAEPAAPASKYAEAPILAEKVAAGELPPVEERLPSDPLVVECIEEPGEYSGDLRRALTGPADIGGYRAIVRESLAGWDYRSGKVEVIPNLASGWDITDDGATYVFHLRKGARWSDGELFTADDIMFWYEHMVLNEELTPTFPGWLTVAGEPGVIEKIDDYTVAFKFAAPYGILLEYLCFSGQQILTPRHYLSQFHPDFADADELSSKVKDAGFEHWY